MSIVSSTFSKESSAQKDGRVWVTESHKLDDGSVQTFQTLCDPKTDIPVMMAARASAINAQEAAANDPAVLKAQAADLRKQAADLTNTADAIDPPAASKGQ